MPRRKQEEEDEAEEPEDLLDDEPPAIEPYTVLGLDKTATADQVKQAYRKAALKHHPDKAAEDQKEAAHTNFQEVAFAYAVLSDPARRKRYDTTGSTSESISSDDFNWTTFYSEQFKEAINADAIETFSKAYKGGDEEKDDVLAAYEQSEGKWEGIYESVMLSNPLEDEDRFRVIIDEGIRKGDVEAFSAYTKESKKSKSARMKAARDEAQEAMEYAEELGVADQLFGKKAKGKKDSGEDALAALIRGRQADRGSFFDHLEEKYASEKKPKGKKGKGQKRGSDEDGGGMISEADFQAASARLKDPKSNGEGEGRKAKRVKR